MRKLDGVAMKDILSRVIAGLLVAVIAGPMQPLWAQQPAPVQTQPAPAQTHTTASRIARQPWAKHAAVHALGRSGGSTNTE